VNVLWKSRRAGIKTHKIMHGPQRSSSSSLSYLNNYLLSLSLSIAIIMSMAFNLNSLDFIFLVASIARTDRLFIDAYYRYNVCNARIMIYKLWVHNYTSFCKT